MKQGKKRFSAVIALALVISVIMVAASTAFAADRIGAIESTPEGTSVHKSVDISQITGEIVEPPELQSAASAIGAEKEWYEYVYYSEEPVGYYYLNDTTRMSFYDPYDYSSSLIMEVDDSITDWSSNNSMQISYTTGDSMTSTKGTSSEAVTSTLLGYTDETTTTTGKSTVVTTTENKTESYNTSKTENHTFDWGLNENIGATIQTTEEAGIAIAGASVTIGGSVDVGSTQHWSDSTTTIVGDKDGKDGGTRTGYTVSNDKVTVDNSGGKVTVSNKIADRVTKATGYTTNSAIDLSTSNSTTITKTYNAGYFNASGAPLQWKIIKYTVMMPMKYQIEYLVDDEWVFGDYNYCLLNTIQGTCRAWLQNNVAYYEHWGTGEPVTWDEFWAKFFTREKLVDAYKNRLYPD